jgi:hypothetical protein
MDHLQHDAYETTEQQLLLQLTVQTAVLDGFGDMFGADRLHPREVGGGARHFEDAIVAPGA